MKFCTKCGKEISEDAVICVHCGGEVQNPVTSGEKGFHKVPKCTCCGNIGPWKVGPIFRPMDWIAGILFGLMGIFPGVIYLAVVGIIRMNENNREKICTKCGGRNLFTFEY